MFKHLMTVTVFGLMGTAAQADEIFTVKAKAVSSHSILKANSVSLPQPGGTTNFEEADSSVNAMGYGLDIEFAIAEYGHLGAGVQYVDYVNDSEDLSYKDLSPNVYGSVDLYKDVNYRIFFKTGVSYHDLTLEDSQVGPVNITYDDMDLWNYDAGLGLQSNLTKQVSMGIEYKYTGTFQSEGVDIEYSGLGLAPTPERLRDIKLNKNEVIASLGVMY